jgi:hypothetical protein
MAMSAMKINQQTDERLLLSESRWVAVAGLLCGMLLVVFAILMWIISPWISLAFALGGVTVAAAASSNRTLLFARDAGVLVQRHRVFGVPTQSVIPLFHIRAVVVAEANNGAGYRCFLDRRIGGDIELDTNASAAPLIAVAKAVAATANLRLVVR